MTVKKNPEYERMRWGDKYITTWLPDPVAILTKLCMGGDDLLVSAEAAERIRSDDDFYSSDLVIGSRNSWYEVVKYRPGKAAARRKTKTTITAKDKHANDLLIAGRELRCAVAEAYISLLEELNDFNVNMVLLQVPNPSRNGYYRNDYNEPETLRIVRQIRQLLVIHAALLGKYAYRYNDVWHEFLRMVRERPRDLNDDTWGNYGDVKEWLEAECKIKKPKPTKRMIAAAAAAEAARLKARTCVACTTVMDEVRELYAPPHGNTKYAPGDKLCGDCWEAAFNVVADEVEQPSVAGTI
jgi:hypothetical protein